MEKETLIELASMLREQYVNMVDLQKYLALGDYDRGKVSGSLEVIEAIERLVEQDVI